MQVGNSHFSSIEQVTGRYPAAVNTEQSQSQKDSFIDILQKTQTKLGQTDTALKFSKHAGARLADRNINLTEEQLSRLEDGAQKAGARGIRESLVLMDGMAFIVNTKNNTVITAMNQSGADENVYTNIDGAVII